jgi:hypothetical protein
MITYGSRHGVDTDFGGRLGAFFKGLLFLHAAG